MKIALFGGSFDPVHLGHIELIKKAITDLQLDQLIIVPTPQNPLKTNSALASNKHRYEMLQISISSIKKASLSCFEIGTDLLETKAAYSIESVRHFVEKFQLSNKQLFFLIGADSLKSLHLWKDYLKLVDLCTFVVFGRADSTKNNLHALNPNLSAKLINELVDNYIEHNYPFSSTEIRAAIMESRYADIKAQLDPKVLNYITAHNLYGSVVTKGDKIV